MMSALRASLGFWFLWRRQCARNRRLYIGGGINQLPWPSWEFTFFRLPDCKIPKQKREPGDNITAKHYSTREHACKPHQPRRHNPLLQLFVAMIHQQLSFSSSSSDLDPQNLHPAS